MTTTRTTTLSGQPPSSPQTIAAFNYNPDPSNPARRLDPTGARRVAVESIAGPTINREVRYSYDPPSAFALDGFSPPT